jgi:hypothetical protein
MPDATEDGRDSTTRHLNLDLGGLPSSSAETSLHHQSSPNGLSVTWLLAPALVMWLATTWTPFDLTLVLVAASSALLVRSAKRVRTVVVTTMASTVVLTVALGAIAFDLLISRLAIVEEETARAVQIWGVVLLVSVWLSIRFGVHRVGLVVILLFSILMGARVVSAVSDPDIDVWRAHQGAARLIAVGGNPYAELDLTLEPGSTEGRLRQYFYPPVTLGWYAGWTLILGDPRWASLIAWLITLLIGSVAAIRAARPQLGIALLAFVAVQPGWFLLLTGSFTEPLIAMLVAASMAAISRYPTLAAVMMALALASKQHLLLVLPMVILAWWVVDRTRAMTVGFVAFLAFSIGLAFGPNEYIAAVLTGPTLTTPNPDGVSLYALANALGLELSLLSWFPILAALLLSISLARQPIRTGWPARQIAVVMATFLFLIPFAIWSHWMIVTLLMTIVAFQHATDVAVEIQADSSGRLDLAWRRGEGDW